MATQVRAVEISTAMSTHTAIPHLLFARRSHIDRDVLAREAVGHAECLQANKGFSRSQMLSHSAGPIDHISSKRLQSSKRDSGFVWDKRKHVYLGRFVEHATVQVLKNVHQIRDVVSSQVELAAALIDFDTHQQRLGMLNIAMAHGVVSGAGVLLACTALFTLAHHDTYLNFASPREGEIDGHCEQGAEHRLSL